jgi:hypothetical protein
LLHSYKIILHIPDLTWKISHPIDPTLPLAKSERGRRSTRQDDDSDEDEYHDQVDDDEDEDDDDFVVDDPDDRLYL